MYIDGAQHLEDLGKLLENQQRQQVQACQQGVLDPDTSTDAEELVDKALKQKYLNTAKDIVEGVAAASSIVATLTQVIEVVQRLL